MNLMIMNKLFQETMSNGILGTCPKPNQIQLNFRQGKLCNH